MKRIWVWMAGMIVIATPQAILAQSQLATEAQYQAESQKLLNQLTE
jgi:hypothetical protein